jgi:dCTP deaminase
MLLTVDFICDKLEEKYKDEDVGLRIIPKPNIDELRNKGGASIDLRLGRWFSSVRQHNLAMIKIDDEQEKPIGQRSYFVPFEENFILHPGRFVLGITLEWIRLPKGIAGYILGRSSWGRRGLIIETASGIQPGFSGCLALELTNVGEVPIALKPGMPICQIFLHETTEGKAVSSAFDGKRRPVLGAIRMDKVLKALTAKMPAPQKGETEA